jgi:hypothetical protein
MRWSNSDPVTGQAAWYDLRVGSKRPTGSSGCQGRHFALSDEHRGQRPPGPELRYGQEWDR